ncbi:MAG: Eco57I restriction-modification methylase domain-containing protein [Endomicrobia bacterium]|nr:Eco57I restriction-modification methylase domain-containing protein [Endomicrobiia bacterium]
MPYTMEELSALWTQEKSSFARKEVGGLQNFVQKVFECKDIFGLDEGKESTKRDKRKNEFIREARKIGKGGQADFVLWAHNNDIEIPVEVEKYGNIKAGEKQLYRYQLERDKKYGILTDGEKWRFYNNTAFKEFYLNDIIENNDVFQTFWSEYTKPENYYLSYFEGQGQQSLFNSPYDSINIEEDRQLFFEDITKLISNFKNKLNIEGYFNAFDKKEASKKATEITYAYFIQFILYKTLVDNCYSNFDSEFKERLEEIHKGLKSGIYGEILNQVSSISKFISDKIYRPFLEEQEFISSKLENILKSPKKTVADVSPWLDIVVFIKKYNFSKIKNDIFGYIYENYLKELYEDTNKGQFFTDPAVVNFMLDEIGFTKNEILKRYKNKADDKNISLIDPSCGSGTFLYSAVDRLIDSIYDESESKAKLIEDLVNNNIFGLDIAEFPLYLAEMSILMRLLPIIVNEQYNNPIDKKIKLFKTNDSIAEFSDTKLNSKENDLPLFRNITKIGYASYIRDEDDLKEMKESLVDAYRRRFDFVIGNPPYIGYNESCKQKILFTQLIKEKKMSMNNMYGINLNTVPNRIKPYSPKPNLYSFFCALGLGLLKEGGKICYIIPQTILTANDLDVLRYFFAKHTTIDTIITFAGKMFVGRGLKQKKPVSTSSLIFILTRKEPKNNHKVKVVNYDNYDDVDFEKFLHSRKKSVNYVEQEELLQKVENWNFIKQNEEFINFYEVYKNNSYSIEDYRRTVLANYDEICLDKGFVFDRNNREDSNNADNFKIAKSSKQYNVGYEEYFINRKNFVIPQGSQGLPVFQKQYKIVWSYTKLKFYFSDYKNLMVGSNWLIISSDNKEEILYLLSLLNSPINILLLNNFLKIDSEALLIASITSIKQYIRIPKISKENQHIKVEVINQITSLLSKENLLLKDILDFSKITKQQFDSVEIKNEKLVLNDSEYALQIPKELLSAVSKAIEDKYGLLLSERRISLSELKNLKIVDTDYQDKIKSYIDDLVFALYFGIPIKSLGLNKAEDIKLYCEKSEFYNLVRTNGQN